MPRFFPIRIAIALGLIKALFCLDAQADVKQLTEKEFTELAQELSPKVNLFRDTWKENPEAEFYGGTTRDYLYWLKGKFRETKTRDQALALATNLKKLPSIDVRDFIIGDSDVDIISSKPLNLKPDSYGVRKIDMQSPALLDPESELGKNERLQGYIPAEKIRLAQGKLQGALGDGVNEIYQGKLSVTFASAEDFAKSKYAREGINHPILLSLRYLRLQAINYFKEHGGGYPNLSDLHAAMSEGSESAVRQVIKDALKIDALTKPLSQTRFQSWLNGAIQKSFRSYTNPTAALELMKDFGVDRLPALYPDKVETINQYVFAKFRDEAVIRANLKKYGADESSVFIPSKNFFPDGKLYHGTRTEPAFRGILFQGILPSEGGAAGAGLYGVAQANKEFSERWGGDKDRLLSFDVEPSARIVDTTQGEGAKLWQASEASHQRNYEKFADAFGIDIIRYPYTPEAFVVKNASVLKRPEGVYRTILTFAEIAARAEKIKDPQEILNFLSVNQLTQEEIDFIWNKSPITAEQLVPILKDPKRQALTIKSIFSAEKWVRNPALQTVAKEIVAERNQQTGTQLATFFLNHLGEMAKNSEELKPIFLGQLHAYLKSPYVLAITQTGSVFDRVAELGLSSPEIGDFLAIQVQRSQSDALEHHIYQAVEKNIHRGIYTDAQFAKLLQSMEGAAESGRIPLYLFTRPFLESGQYRDEIYAAYWKRLATEKQPLYRMETLFSLGKYFPDDSRIVAETQAFFLRSIGAKNSVPSAGQMAKLYETLPESSRLKSKNLLFDGFQSAEKEQQQYSAKVLSELPLTDMELTSYMDALLEKDLRVNYLGDVLLKHIDPLTPESVKALVRSTLLARPSAQTDFEYPKRLGNFLKEAGRINPKLVEKKLLEQLRLLPTPNLRIYGDKANIAFSAAGELFVQKQIPFTLELQKAMLTIQESVAEKTGSASLLPFFCRELSMDNPAIRARAEKLLASPQTLYDSLTFRQLVTQIRRPSPQLLLSLKRTFAEKKSAFNSDDIELQKYLENHRLPLTGCGSSFATLGK